MQSVESGAMSFFDLRKRVRQPEIMDQPGLEENLHVEALRGLERINRWSLAGRVLWPAVKALLPRKQGPVRLLDVATGGADVPLYLWQKAKKAGWPLQIDACDRSGTALSHARQRASQVGAAVHFFQWDVLAGPFPDNYDVVMCSLFMHHLEEDQAIQVLNHMAQAARHLVLVNDLCRNLPGLLLAYLGTRVLSASPVVHTDGPLSVRAAFTPSEARQLAQRAGLEGATVQRCWPFRWLLTWRRNFADIPAPKEEAGWTVQPLGQPVV
jgi:2-polyprenyl-3-methyl-5-hydroxy-6-metoxy-1,4-benzoquinol methylase